jgi:hypothetical protein
MSWTIRVENPTASPESYQQLKISGCCGKTLEATKKNKTAPSIKQELVAQENHCR